MSHYSDNPAMVRVDFFKISGKWYATEAIKWVDYDGAIDRAFAKSLKAALLREDGSVRYSGMTAVCLEPYHEHAYPQMMGVDYAMGLADHSEKFSLDKLVRNCEK